MQIGERPSTARHRGDGTAIAALVSTLVGECLASPLDLSPPLAGFRPISGAFPCWHDA